MPISRKAYQIGVPGDQDDSAEVSADAFDKEQSGSIEASIGSGTANSGAGPNGDPESRTAGDARAKESPQEVRQENSFDLPPADPTSAEKKEAFGAAHPQRETHRSVATGRDVPQFTPASAQRESGEIDWNEARAQTEIYGRRAEAQKSAATEHLARIHDVVELLIEMSEAHSNDGERKLQSLESKVAELEMRYAVNRSSQ